MSKEMMGMIIGGVVPAILFGVSGVLQKLAVGTQIGTGWYTCFLGLGVVFVGLMWQLIQPGNLNLNGMGASALVGFVWAVGTACIAFALGSFGTPIAKLVPLYNMNTLFAVALGLLFFAEAAQLNLFKLFLGATFIAVGGILVAKS